MIEPQNTMLPFAPRTTAKETPEGALGFGEMLAQTLGMVPRFDASALIGVTPDHSHGNGDGEGEPAEGDSGTHDDGRRVVAPVVPVPNQSYVVPVAPVTDDTVVAEVTNPLSDTSGAADTGMRGDQPIAVEAEDVVGDGIDLPVLEDQTTVTTKTETTPDEVPAPIENGNRSTQPVPAPETFEPPVTDPKLKPAVAEVDPVSEPSGDEEPPLPAEPVQPVVGRDIDPADLEAVAEEPAGSAPISRVPTPPTPTTTRPPGSAPISRVPTPPTPTTTRPAGAAKPEGDTPGTQTTTQVESVSVADAGRVPLRESRVELESGTTPIQNTAPSLSPENVAGRTATVSGFTSLTPSGQHTALAERVLDAVELQANQPPPRTMIVDIPEVEGLRLVVSVRSGAEVHVVPASTSSVPAGLQGFMNELDTVLADRGFVMTGDGRRRGGNPQPDNQRELPRRPRPAASRPLDNDLRI